MLINRHTRISEILAQSKDALEVIAGIHPRFSKLRNPLLRKIMAGRVSLEQAAKVGGCRVEDFYKALAPLGFSSDGENPEKNEVHSSDIPQWFLDIRKYKTFDVDVRALLDSGGDPLPRVLSALRSTGENEIVCVINSFVPEPIISIAAKKGFEYYTDISEDPVRVYFLKTRAAERNEDENGREIDPADWKMVLEKFGGHMKRIDVRSLEMPGPMLTILEALDSLPRDTALFVHHKKVPVYLLPELQERGYAYAVHEIEEGNIELIIYRKDE